MDSGSDLSFSSVDNVPVTRGLEELRGHYLDTIARIRSDVLDHVNQTKASAAKKIRYRLHVYSVYARENDFC